MSGHILTINTGSSSVKFAVYQNEEEPDLLVAGEVSAIGTEHAVFSIKGKEKFSSVESHKQAFQLIFEWLKAYKEPFSIEVIAHRLVHGGEKFQAPVVINECVMKALKRLISYDPLHMTSEVMGVLCCQEVFKEALSIACFDTAFHSTLPEESTRYALPGSLYESGVRRYGFHGLSYEYITQELKEEAKGKVIMAHLGSGSSVTALKEGNSFVTSMGFTSTAGVVMGTRPGDLDPGMLLYLLSERGYTVQQLIAMINKESGLKGLSGTTGEMKELLKKEDQDRNASLAITIYCRSIRMRIGAYAALLGGVETLVFTGGIGERSAVIRKRICEDLEFLGVSIDASANAHNASRISKKGAKVNVLVMKTNEELMLCRHANQLARKMANK